MGLAKFGKEWTGKEHAARRMGGVNFEGPRELEDSSIWPDEGAVIPVPSRPQRWRVITTAGLCYTQTQEEANEVWRNERPKLEEMWRDEKAARERFEEAVLELRHALNGGALQAWVHRLKIGDTIEIPAHIWGREDAGSVFELGGYRPTWHNPNIIAFFRTNEFGAFVEEKGRVVLGEDDVEAFLKSKTKKATSTSFVRAEKECADWILELASESGERKTKEELWIEVQDRWPERLSRRGFDRAWGSAAAPDWRKRGRPKTSQ